ncbi:MAG: dihydroorotase [Bacteroidales bacterium]|nr:MAG: dihydroorotase [Bacteroidales bacterium]
MAKILIRNATIINEGRKFKGNVLINNEIIEKIYEEPLADSIYEGTVIDAKDKILIPGVIDDHVHFREPGLTHKADIASESRASVAGGVTSFMDMPNTDPQTITQDLLEEKYRIAEKSSLANYSFYIGATDSNLKELLKINPREVCGIKIFMGSSTGNMLVSNVNTLKDIYSQSGVVIAAHCEDEDTIVRNIKKYKKEYGQNIHARYHPLIRSTEACYKSSSLAVKLALKYNTRLHILHVSTGKELKLFSGGIPAAEKRITSEVSIHHLWFSDSDYETLGTRIKCNPAIKSDNDREALFKAMLEGKIDVVGTDHAPHTIIEKNSSYFKAASGLPMIQHSLLAMLEFYHQGRITLEKIVEKMCHAPADIFQVEKRGYIREGYWADLVLVDINHKWEVTSENILYKCKWSPFENVIFHSDVSHTFVNGNLVYREGNIIESSPGKRLLFVR